MDRIGKLFLILITLFQVSVYQQWRATSQITIRALKGSCVVIPCTFNSPKPLPPSNELHIAWNRRPFSLIYSDTDKDISAVMPAYRGRTDFVGDLETGNCSLQINNVRKEDEAEYYPWIKPITDSYVLYKVDVSENPEEQSLTDPGVMTEGTPVNITCSAVHSCLPNPPTLIWDKHSIKSSIHHVDLKDGRWKTVSDLIYTPTSEDHGKSLQCIAIYTENIFSNRSITLEIKYSPKNTTAFVVGNETLIEGGNVTLSCFGAGNPPLSLYRWYEGYQKAVLQDYGQQVTLTNIAWDSGPYYCTAQNEVGIEESPYLDLQIQYAPKGTHVKMPPNSPKEGQLMTLECVTNSSSPEVGYYLWYKDGSLLQNQTEKTLEVNKMTPADSGEYHCEAHNNAGSSSSAFVTVRVVETRSRSALFAALGLAAAFLLLSLLPQLLALLTRCKHKQLASVHGHSNHQDAREELVYITIDHSKRPGPQRQIMASDDFVTYAAVRRSSENEEPASAEDVTYAKVKKLAKTPQNKQKEEESIRATDIELQHPTSNGQESHNNDGVESASVG